MSDVTAVVLSIGEPTVERAREALARQTYPLHDVLVIENVSPFHRALNEAARRVATPFLLQVDADMIPDPRCVAELRAAMSQATGVTCGELRDPLLGQVVGIKLFRTEVVRAVAVPDTIAQDVDFIEAMSRAGWEFKYVGRPPDEVDGRAETYGEHRPDYTVDYTFRKFLIEGRRYRYRGARGGLFWRMTEFERLTHPLVPLARIAQSHGFFLETERDELRPAEADPRAGLLSALLESEGTAPSVAEGLFPLERFGRLRDVFRAFLNAGHGLADARAGASTHEITARLAGRPHDWRALVAQLGLGHGLLGGGSTAADASRDERQLKSFVLYGSGRRVGQVRHVIMRAESLALKSGLWRTRIQWLRNMPPW